MPSRSRSSLRRKLSKPVLKRTISLRVEELESRLLLDATPSGYTPHKSGMLTPSIRLARS